MNLGWREWSRGQWLVRAVVLLGPLLALLARWPTEPPRLWLILLTLTVSAGWAAAPESVIGGVALLLVGFSWAGGLGGEVPLGALVAAVAMLAAHVAAVIASYGPDALPISSAVVRLWVRRGLGVAVAAPLVWLVARAVRELPSSETVWLAGMAVALSVALVAGAATQASTPREDG